MNFPSSIFALDITGANVDATGLVWEKGDADHPCLPVPGSLRPLPWIEPATAQIILQMAEADGSSFFADPRTVLERVVKRLAARDITPVVAVELEFMLFDMNRPLDGPPVPAMPPGAARDQAQVYSLAELDIYAPVLEEMQARAAEAELPADTTITEYGVAQFEINLKHRNDPLIAADEALFLKRLIKGVAAKHGMMASFMPKPFDDATGNGQHIHISLETKDGRRLFESEDLHGSVVMRHAIAGVLEILPESLLLLAPGINSHRRLAPGSYAPTSLSWAFNNRTVALRIPYSDAAARRFEFRVAGADAHPHLVMAVLLAGVHHGIAEALEPPDPITGNAYEQLPQVLAMGLDEALALFDRAAVLPHYFGADFCHVYSAVRRQDRDRFRERVTPLEWDWYLRDS